MPPHADSAGKAPPQPPSCMRTEGSAAVFIQKSLDKRYEIRYNTPVNDKGVIDVTSERAFVAFFIEKQPEMLRQQQKAACRALHIRALPLRTSVPGNGT